MSDFFGKLKSGAGKVAFEAEKMSHLNKAKGELEKIKSQVQAQYMKIGEMYYTQRATTGVTGPAFDEICQAITDLEGQLEAKNEEIKAINADTYAPQAAQPAAQPAVVANQPAPAPIPTQSMLPSQPAPDMPIAKFCPNCGREIPAGSKFCPDCGTKV